MGTTIETVSTERFSMKYIRFGTGEKAAVILPGLSVRSVMHAAETLEQEYGVLTRDFTVYVFDRREELPSVYPVFEMARDTAEAIQELGLKDLYLFGASQGGMIAMEIAIGYPELVKRMVLGSTSPHLERAQFRRIEEWIRLAEEKNRVGLYLSFGEAIYPPELYRKHREGLIRAAQEVTDEDLERFVILARGIKGFNIVDKLKRIRCPVLAIGVFEDPVVDSDATMQIAEKLEETPGFELYMYIGYGHSAFDTAPDYQERILRFFEEGEDQGRAKAKTGG